MKKFTKLPRLAMWIPMTILVTLCASTLAQTSSPESGDVSTVDLGATQPISDRLRLQIKEGLTDGKKRLAKNLLSADLNNRESVNVTPAFTWKLGTIKGSAASTFRSFNQSFILAGKVLYRLTDGSGPTGFRTEEVAQFQDFLGEVAFLESVEWDGLLYLVAAFKQGLLQLFTVSPENKVILRQSIDCHGIPTDAEFFMHDDTLFLVVTAENGAALVPAVVVYRWYGTQLDQEGVHLDIHAVAVSSFLFQESVIIVIAVGATSSRTAGLIVFRHSGSKLKMVHFLPVSHPTALQHYMFRSENYLLVTNAHGPSVICWWAGTELIVWDTLEHNEEIRSVGVGYVRGETLILLAEAASIKIYRPTAATFQLVDTHMFSAAVQSASLYIRDESISLLAITALEGNLVPHILQLKLSFQPASVRHRILVRDPLLQCISTLEDGIRNRRLKLQDIAFQSKNVMLKSTPGRFSGKLVVKKLVPINTAIRSFKLIPNETSDSLVMSAHELRNGIQSSINLATSLTKRLKNVVYTDKPSSLRGKLTADEVEIKNANMDSVIISYLNGLSFNPGKLLMYSKDQKLTGFITADSISADTLTVGRLNNLRVTDLLRRSVKYQMVTGLEQVTNVKVNKITIASQTPVNGIPLKRFVVAKSPRRVVSVAGAKTLAGLDLQQLAVTLLNNVNFTQWISSLVPPSPTPLPVPVPQNSDVKNLQIMGDLSIQNLIIHGKVNGVSLNDLLSSLFLKGLRQNIIGDVTYRRELGVDYLEASVVNGVPTSSFLTRTTDQIITGSFSLESLTAPDLLTRSLNGLQLSRDAAYINSPFAVTTSVVFDHVQSHELTLPPNVNISGQPVGRRLFNQPKIIYQQSVVVKGTLKLTDVKLEHATVLLNGNVVDLKNLRVNYWSKSTDQVIPNNLHAPNGLDVRMLKIDTINSLRLENFVDLSSTKILQGTWHFPSVTIVGNLVHDTSASQVPVSLKQLASTIVKTSGDYTVSGTKIFVDGLTMKHLVTDYLDGKKVSDLLEGGKGSEENDQEKKFEEIWVGGDLVVRSNFIVGSVNHVNLCDRLSKALLIDQSGHIPAAVISALSATNIDVKTFNEVPFSVIARGGNKTTMPRVRKITIKGDVFIPAFLNVMSVNNKALTSNYLSRVVDRTQSGIIRGKKTFASQLLVEGSFDALNFNGVDLKELFSKALSKTRDQTISSVLWMNNMVAEELKTATVNDIPVGDLLTSDSMSRQTVEGDLVVTNDLDVLGFVSASSIEDGCDLNLVSKMLQYLDGRHWTSLTVEGNMNWNDNLPLPMAGLSYYLESAVTRHSTQPISGEVAFIETVHVNNFNSRKDINDVDINGILSDSLRKSLGDQVIHGSKIFVNRLTSTSMEVTGNVVAKTVAGVNIAEFNNSLVRVGGDQEVRGNKRFLQGFSADLLRVDGTVNGLVTSDIVNYDMELLPPIHFAGPLEISGDLKFEIVNDHSLDNLLQTRVTLNGGQQIEGHITFARDLTVLGDMVAPSINRLDIADIVQRESLNEQVISGRKHFIQGLRVEGPIEVDYLENVHLRTAHQAALFKNENATISGNLVFGNIVTMEGNLNVDTTVNNVEMSELARQLLRSTSRSLAQVRSIAHTINETNLLLKARGDLSEMLYLEPVHEVPISFTNTHSVIASGIAGGETYLNMYGWVPNTLCGLPASCACPAQYSVQVQYEELGPMIWNTGVRNNKSERSYTFHLEEPHVTVIVKTNTVSQSNRCRKYGADRLDEVTLITWVAMDNNKDLNEVLREITLEIEGTPILGYVSDVKAITDDNRVYLILAIAYNADLDTTDLNSVIVRLDTATHRARVVGEFPTHGVSTLDVFYTNKGPHLVVGNSFSTAKDSSQVFLDIYRFNARSEQLLLVKSIPADGVVSVASVVQGGDSLIVVAQKQQYAPVTVFKYDSAHDDYHFMQQLNPNTIPTSVGVFYIGHQGLSDAFLGVSTTEDQFYLYKFCHVEGFKLIMKMELQGVHGFSTFFVGPKQYLLFTSTESPSIFEIVKQLS